MLTAGLGHPGSTDQCRKAGRNSFGDDSRHQRRPEERRTRHGEDQLGGKQLMDGVRGTHLDDEDEYYDAVSDTNYAILRPKAEEGHAKQR